MGLLDKIEDKFKGSNKDEEQQIDRPTTEGRTNNPVTSSTTHELHSSRQHPIGSGGTTGTAITGGTALESGAHGRPHGTSSTVPGSFPGESDYGSTGIPDRTRGDHTTTSGMTTTTTTTGTALGDHSGSNTTHNTARKPFDPYSSSGQQIAANAADDRNTYGASNNRGPAGDVGSRRTHEDSSVLRTQHGGISNQLHSGPHPELENRDAVPTAGGHKVGTGAVYESPSQAQQSHYGRDAALTSGVATAGLGAGQGRDRTGLDSGRETTQKTAGPHNSDLMNKLDPRVDSNPNKSHGTHGQTTTTTTSDRPEHSGGYQGYSSQDPLRTSGSQSQHQYGRDAAMVGGAGVVGAGAASQYTSRQHDPQEISYMNRPAADQPLSQSKDFTTRHGGIGTGTTTGTTSSIMTHGSGRDHIAQQPSGTSYAGGPTTSSNDPSIFNKSDTTRGHGMTGASIFSSRHAGYDTDRVSHGGGTYGVGYEKGYEAGYRDALAHAETVVRR